MRALRLMRSKTPLSSAAILEIFQKIRACLGTLHFEIKDGLSPVSGDLFLVDGLDSSLPDGQVYAEASDVFNEEKFNVVIDKTLSSPCLFRFVYYNRNEHYRLVHYLVCEKKPEHRHPPRKGTVPPVCEKLVHSVLERYSTLQNIILPHASAKASMDPIEDLDTAFWSALIQRHLSS
ncbi:hypothetical protein NECID01_1403 [Nematocida sp. AWRm77]|nr:hypothetical protein NECID01_1403 [Nematocida sp. AWRm77]